jgi:PPOX class probable F420-dependent enzyme
VDVADARARFAAARVARLATADAAGRPHLVPICFAVAGDTVYSAVDEVKPKATRRLRRLANVAANPAVSLLADHYDEDWSALWWVRADGDARVVEAEQASAAVELLARRYAQYRESPPEGPVVAVAVERWSGWSAGG